MAEPRPRVNPPIISSSPDDDPLLATFRDDLDTLARQVAGGVSLLTEILDLTKPGWDAPRHGRKPLEESAARYAWGQLHITWINLCTLLMEAGVKSWDIEPLETKNDGVLSQWEWRADGGLEFSSDGEGLLEKAQIPVGVVRERSEPHVPRFTLEEAAEILGTTHTHAWTVVLDEDHRPVAVACAFCAVRRSVLEE